MCWIIDSGATDHATYSIELLDPKNLLRTTTISLPDGGQAHIESIGSLHVTPHIKLDDVLKVPQFQVNLLSVSKLTRALQCIVLIFVLCKTLLRGRRLAWVSNIMASTTLHTTKIQPWLTPFTNILIFGINVLGTHHPILFKFLLKLILKFILIPSMFMKFAL